jgi:hypothetical protein
VSGGTLEVRPVARPAWATGSPLSPSALDAAQACRVSPELLMKLDAPTQTRCGQIAALPMLSRFGETPPTIDDPHQYECSHSGTLTGDVYFAGHCYWRAELNAAYSCHIAPSELVAMPADERNDCIAASTREAMARVYARPLPSAVPAPTPFSMPVCGGPLGLTHGCVSKAVAPSSFSPIGVPPPSRFPVGTAFPGAGLGVSGPAVGVPYLPDRMLDLGPAIVLGVLVALWAISHRARTFAQTEAGGMGWVGLLVLPLHLLGIVGAKLFGLFAILALIVAILIDGLTAAAIAAAVGFAAGYAVAYAISLLEQPFYRFLERHTKRYSNDRPTDVRTIEGKLLVPAVYPNRNQWS